MATQTTVTRRIVSRKSDHAEGQDGPVHVSAALREFARSEELAPAARSAIEAGIAASPRERGAAARAPDLRETDMKAETDRLVIPFEVKTAPAPTAAGSKRNGRGKKSRRFAGYASAWRRDFSGDVIEPGAFEEAVKSIKAGGYVPLLDSHRTNSVLSAHGRMVDAREDSTGLWAEFEVVDSPSGDELLARVKGGYVRALSIGYEAIDHEPIKGGGRLIKKIRLMEVSTCLFGMNPRATIEETGKAAGGALAPDHPRRRRIERRLTEIRRGLAGVSPDDPHRLEMESRLRELRLRGLASRN